MIPDRPIGYAEVQRSWLGHKSSLEVEDIALSVIDKTVREQPELESFSSRLEIVADGAGVPHYTLYVSFVPRRPRTAEPLNPRNLNEAPVPPVGSMPMEDIMPLGTKELKF